MGENGRELVLDMLLEMERQKEYSHRLVRAVLDKYDYLDPKEKAFIKRLSEGTVERKLEMDYYLNHFSKLPVNKMRPLIRCLLRMSVYQLLYMDMVPDNAVCDEACKLAAKRGFRSLKGFVNGILRTIARNRDKLPVPDREKDPVGFFSVKYSVPEWLVRLWMEEYGKEAAAVLLDGLLAVHPVSLRFSSSVSCQEQETLQNRMEEQGARVAAGPYLPNICLLEHAGGGLHVLPGFQEGRLMVQDVSSALAVEAAGIRQGDFVVDVCGAPGGKSICAAEKAVDGRVLSRDVSEEKVALIRENVRRMGIGNVDCQVYDAVCQDNSLGGRADVVLLDVPCSGLGVMGKKRDIKYNVTPSDLSELAELQRRIVDASAGYVKPGGTLIYSTCTIHSKENEDMVRHIAEELGFEPVSLEGLLPERLFSERRRLEEDMQKAGKDPARGLSEREYGACIQLLPGYMESDGFFLAKFRRKDIEEPM